MNVFLEMIFQAVNEYLQSHRRATMDNDNELYLLFWTEKGETKSSMACCTIEFNQQEHLNLASKETEGFVCYLALHDSTTRVEASGLISPRRQESGYSLILSQCFGSETPVIVP